MEPNSHNEHRSSEQVLAKIREKRVSMRPKILFTAESLLVALVTLVILIVSIAIVSFILFSLRINGHDSLLGFGPRGVSAFFILFPWPLFILDVLLILFLERLMHQYKFGYRSPMLYLLGGLFVLATVFGLLIDRATSFNDHLRTRAHHGGLPAPLGDFYEHARTPAPHDHGIYRGVITQIGTSTLRMSHDDLDADEDDTDYLVILPPLVEIEDFSVGEPIYVAGDMEEGVIHAFGISELPDENETPAPALP